MPGGFSGVSGVYFHSVTHHVPAVPVTGGLNPLTEAAMGRRETIGLIKLPSLSCLSRFRRKFAVTLK